MINDSKFFFVVNFIFRSYTHQQIFFSFFTNHLCTDQIFML